MNARRLLPAAVALAALAGVAWWTLVARSPRPQATEVASEAAPAAAAPGAATFVGSEACAPCHESQTVAWRGSQHQRAMQRPGPDTVQGDFAAAPFRHAGVTTTFARRGDRYFVRTDGPDGQLADYEVRYVFGVAPLEQYLVELPGGRLQALAVAWDSRPQEAGGQRWFHLYPDERIDFRDELHWTRPAQNWNFMCADCHSTNVRKGYDAERDAFRSEYSEISVGCEACHGPGSAHLEWARRKPADPTRGLTVALDERRGVGWRTDPASGRPRRSVPRSNEREIEVCAQCHSRRAQIAEGYVAGRPFLDHYLPSLLAPGLYHPDGQQREEVYVWGSWLQSRMHRAGVTCSDCHEPHGQKLRAPGNGVCAQCHDASRYDAAAHHRHEPGSAGAQCADCHMPRATYMVVDPRRDHGMRVPRPDESAEFGVPNACNACHAERDAKWAAAAVRGWLGRDAAGLQNFTRAFHAAETGAPGASAALSAVAGDAGQPAWVRASALARLGGVGRFDPELARRAAADPEPLLRLAATRLGEALPPEIRGTMIAPLLDDPRRSIRIEAARSLAGAQDSLSADRRAAWQTAVEEYRATLRYNADRPESGVALGGLEGTLGRLDAAQAAFERAIRLDPDFVPAYVNAADVLRAAGRDADAAAMLERGLARVADSAALHHALGLTLVRRDQPDRALEELRRAAELEPDSPRYAYVHAVALHSSGRAEEAIRRLELAARRWTNDRDVLLALASFKADAGDRDGARRAAQRLLEAHPGDPEAQALAAQLAR